MREKVIEGGGKGGKVIEIMGSGKETWKRKRNKRGKEIRRKRKRKGNKGEREILWVSEKVIECRKGKYRGEIKKEYEKRLEEKKHGKEGEIRGGKKYEEKIRKRGKYYWVRENVIEGGGKGGESN